MKFFLFTFFLFLSKLVFANSWVLISQTAQADVYLNMDSIKKVESSIFRVEQIMNFNKPIKDGLSSFNSLYAVSEFDCALRQQRRTQITSYSQANLQGKIISNKTYNENFKPLQENTAGYTVLKVVCK